jgi:hypothetical protein
VSKLEFGLEMAAAAGFEPSAVTRGKLADAGLAAERPLDMSIDSSLCTAVLHRPAPGVHEGLARFVAHRGVPLSARFVEDGHG